MHTPPKHALVFDGIQAGLRAGRFLPGEHLKAPALARAFHTSTMPVRYALYGLSGTGLIDWNPGRGFYVPMLDQSHLAGRYDWMGSLLLEAIERGNAAHAITPLPTALEPQDTPNATWRLFDAITEITDNDELRAPLKRANDQLAPVRHAKEALLDDAHDELAALYGCWAARDLPSLKAGLRDYQRRRRAMAPKIVSHLRQKLAALH
ncbi:GntR family transcriptional regulator [Luteimonas sp. S4-F44]|uniref:GntR family transcriptional regulator n=1 Tax=Luteimonas sp. S4-F44 TaxID=2925842 RepID=UPI001F53881E|nr:GntR family transcriptional regulator [Luteimonas sp. S4-F44]UNK42129.1 GntR family transcriptional regulator [Luteimonas sp. S4-F44]